MIEEGAASVENALLTLFLGMGVSWVLYVLIALSVLSFGLMLERAWYFFNNRVDFRELQDALTDSLRQPASAFDTQSLLRFGSLGKSLARLGKGLAHGLNPSAIEQRVLSESNLAKSEMSRGLVFLGTLGNNAPFLGLFGTVLGIIRAFRDLALDDSLGASAVMTGIAEALIATAVGLLVALPAVAAYNVFQQTIKKRAGAIESLGRLIVAKAHLD